MIEFIQGNWEGIMLILTSLVTLASAIAALTPTEKDDKIVSKIVNVFALNVDTVKSKE